jgi:hypothetical protein
MPRRPHQWSRSHAALLACSRQNLVHHWRVAGGGWWRYLEIGARMARVRGGPQRSSGPVLRVARLLKAEKRDVLRTTPLHDGGARSIMTDQNACI